jgi:hypothetical protein
MASRERHVQNAAMNIAPTQYGGEANARDQFLCAIDDGNSGRASALAANLTTCTNPLPSTTCTKLGLPIGSTYASAAHLVLSDAAPVMLRASDAQNVGESRNQRD